MVQLCHTQRSDLDRIYLAAGKGLEYLSSILLIGASGAGKRTLALMAAQELCMKFVEIPVNDQGESVSDRLFGIRKEAERAIEYGIPPGELGTEIPSLIFLSGIENLDLCMSQTLYRLISTRTYIDKIGYKWRLDNNIWLVGSISYPANNFSINPENWQCTAFSERIVIKPPVSKQDLLLITKNVLKRNSLNAYISEDAILLLVDLLPQTPNYLHSLVKWISLTFHYITKGDTITKDIIYKAVIDDVQYLLMRVPYRGCIITMEHFEHWYNQFPSDYKHYALKLLREICERYYIGTGLYHEILQNIINRLKIPHGNVVTFCKWQPLGRSGPRVSHDLKNQANWRVNRYDINLNDPTKNWPPLGGHDSKYIIITDDFLGTGDTLSKLFVGKTSSLERILNKYENANIFIIIIAGFEENIRKIRTKCKIYNKRIKLIVGHLLKNEDRCFVPESRILPDPLQRDKFQKFCLFLSKKYFPNLHSQMPFGYGNLGSVVVFFNTVPNNSLPLIWYDRGEWVPLFPASGLPSS